jgi:very-short-patch-repair endonuclease
MKRKIIPYNKNLKVLARNLRNHSTLAEVLLWKQLKGKQIGGYDFHRQKPIDKYIVDFYCRELNLVIEIDGRSHLEKYDEDINRQHRLESLGLHILRFTDSEVKNNLIGVVSMIEDWIDTPTHDTPL